jgi:membrane protease YdiL (CAAX protease family)
MEMHDRKSGTRMPPKFDRAPIMSRGEWAKLLVGLGAVFALFQGLAEALESVRGQAGLLVAGAVLAALIVIEWLLFGRSPAAAMGFLGLGRPAGQGMIVAAGLSGLLLAVIPAYAYLQADTIQGYPGWGWLIPGLFAQAGIAEEMLFRGYLFRHLRQGQSFWRAAGLTAVPFTLVHLYLFWTLPWPIAAASVLLAISISFPLAYLFELGGNTIWGPALLHFIVQGAVKVVIVRGGPVFPLLWLAASATIPWLAFAFGRRLK